VQLLTISVDNYQFLSWKECFPNDHVDLRALLYNPSWNDFFDLIEKKPYYKNMLRILDGYMKGKQQMVPPPNLVFNACNITPLKHIKVVIMGQDPYFNSNIYNGMDIPQAMGCSFSVPFGYKAPPSLDNIYNNLVDFGHVKTKPVSGCLLGWILQGCFMINSSFTTFLGKANQHVQLWEKFTEDLILYLNDNCEKIVFLAWGANAIKLCSKIDHKKHHIIYSSHPSGFSFMATVKGRTPNGHDIIHPSFKSTDHFGKTNEYLKANGKKPILWDMIDDIY